MEVKCIEQVEATQLQSLVRLEAEAFGVGGMNEWHLVPLIRHGKVFCLQDGEHTLGCVQYMLDWERKTTAYMVGISIDHAWRGRGLGKRLLTESFSQLRSLGIERVELTVSPENHGAIALYEQVLGFRAVAYRPGEYGEGEDRLVLVLDFVNQSKK